MPKKVSRIAQQLAYLHYGPIALEGCRRDTEYLRILFLAGIGKSTGVMKEALKTALTELSEKRRELASVTNDMEDLMDDVTKEYKVV